MAWYHQAISYHLNQFWSVLWHHMASPEANELYIVTCVVNWNILAFTYAHNSKFIQNLFARKNIFQWLLNKKSIIIKDFFQIISLKFFISVLWRVLVTVFKRYEALLYHSTFHSLKNNCVDVNAHINDNHLWWTVPIEKRIYMFIYSNISIVYLTQIIDMCLLFKVTSSLEYYSFISQNTWQSMYLYNE